MEINGNGKVEPPLSPKPLNRWSLNMAGVMKSGTYSYAKFYYDPMRVQSD